MPAVITPFDDRGEVDPDAHGFNLALLAGRGIEGFLVAGSTGEGPYLEPGERRTLVRAARAAVPDAYLMSGIAAETVRVALAQAAEAADGGADSVLVVTPTSLVRGRDDLVAGYYREVADRSPLPVFLYSVPKVTGYELPTELATGLSGHPSVAGIKDSGGHPVRVPALLEGAPPGFSVYSGSSPALNASIAAGARGGITASANYAGALAGEVVTAAGASPAQAATRQAVLTEVAAVVERHGISGVKAAGAMTGLRPGTVRRPLVPLSPDAVTAIRAALEAAAII